MARRAHVVLFLVTLLATGCTREAADITESKARSLAEKEMEKYCGGEGGKCTDFYSKGTHPASDPRFKWAFHWDSEFTDPRRLMIVMVSQKGETAVRIKNVPPPTAEELSTASASPSMMVAEAPPGGDTAPSGEAAGAQ